MIVHIFNDSPHHYVAMRKFLLSCSDKKQSFWVFGQPHDTLVESHFTYFSTEVELLGALCDLSLSNYVIFHGLFQPSLIRKLLISKMHYQSACVIWGGEVYRYRGDRNLSSYLNQFIHMALLRRFDKVFTLNQGDAAIVKNHLFYSYADVLPYPLIDFIKTDNPTQCEETVKLIVGNSADPSNRHLDILPKLAECFANRDVELYLPLNYGGSVDYIKQVCELGQELFGDRFKALQAMMPKVQYDALLQEVDAAILFHNRQQGLYVVYAMLSQGKPVFLSEGTSSYQNLKQQGFAISTTEWLIDSSAEESINAVRHNNKNNAALMETTYSEQALRPKWGRELERV